MTDKEMWDKVISCIDEFKTVSICRNLIKIPSYKGMEGDASDYIAREMDRQKMEVIENIVEHSEGRRSLIGIIRGNGTGKNLMLSAHIDHHYWTPPDDTAHEAMIKESKVEHKGLAIFGPGTTDSLSTKAAMFGAIDAIQKAKIDLKGDIALFTGAEELGDKEESKDLMANGFWSDYGIMGEPTALEIGIVHAGKVEVEIITKGGGTGVTAHAEAVGQAPVNAVLSMAKVINYLQRMEKEDPFFNQTHPLISGKGAKLVYGAIIGGGPEYADPLREGGPRKGQHGLAWLPNRCKMRIGCRYWPGQSSKDFLSVLHKWLSKARQDDQTIDTEVRVYLDGAAAFEEPKDSPIVKILQRTGKYVLGKEPGLMGCAMTCENVIYREYGMPTAFFGIGPFYSDSGEHVTIEDLLNLTKIYALSILEVCT